MPYALYSDAGGVRAYVKDSPVQRLEFSEHPRDAILFASQQEASIYLALRQTREQGAQQEAPGWPGWEVGLRGANQRMPVPQGPRWLVKSTVLGGARECWSVWIN